MSDDEPLYGLTSREAYNVGHRDGERVGRAVGEMERIALATANSELRSQVRELVNAAFEAARGGER